MRKSIKNLSDFYILNKVVIYSIIFFLIQLLVIKMLGANSVYFLCVLTLLLASIPVYSLFIKNMPIFLLIINLLPLIFLNNWLYYSTSLVIAQDIPLYLFVVFAFFKFIKDENFIEFRISYLKLPILLLTIYFFMSCVVGYSNGYALDSIGLELYQLLYYSLFIVVSYLITERKHYHYYFLTLAIVVLIISVQYIYLNFWVDEGRFVTFQGDIFPIIIGMMLTTIMYQITNKNPSFLLIIILGIIIIGLFSTLTRSLWVSVVLTIFSAVFFYFKDRKKTFSWEVVFFLIILLGGLFTLKSDFSQKATNSNKNNVQYRTQSIVKPGEDISFLMRMEIGYHVINRYVLSPIIGRGLGDHVKYRILNPFPVRVYYPDGSWLYFLWKLGLIGFVLWIWMFFRFFKQTYLVFKKSDRPDVKALTLGIFCGGIGIIFISLLSPNLMKYKLNIVYAIMFAYIEFEKQNLLKNENKI